MRNNQHQYIKKKKKKTIKHMRSASDAPKINGRAMLKGGASNQGFKDQN